jgi:general secretion pathway protein G
LAIEGKVPHDIRFIESACEAYSIDNDGVYPSALEQILMPDPDTIGYLRSTSLPRDPWGRAYLYAAPDEHCRDPRIWTYGRDGLPGGEGDDADHDNWALRFDLSPP